MTVLSVLNDVCDRFSLPQLSTAVGSTNETARQLLSYLKDVGVELRDRVDWPELTRVHTIELVSGQDAYALPEDHDRWIYDTGWNQDRNQPITFPTSAQDWNLLKYGYSVVSLLDQVRVFGSSDNQIVVHPTPNSGNSGQSLSIEYISKMWFRPATWTASTKYAAGSYAWNNGNVYYTSAGGTSGSSAPTHSSGTTSDGGVSWVRRSSYLTLTADTDEFLIDDEVVKACLLWLFAEAKGMEFSTHQRRFEQKLARAKTKKRGAHSLLLNRRAEALNWGYQVPLGNWSES